jgi:hypothetical protein
MKKLALVVMAAILLPGMAPCESSLSAGGYGLQFEAVSARSTGLGLSGLALPDPLSLDLVSPANWQGSQTARFGFTTYFSHESVTDATGSDAGDNGGIAGVGLAVHLGKEIFAGFAITPYTQMDYRWRSAGSLPWAETLTKRQGEGGISQALVGTSFPVRPDLRLGLALRPVFGKVERLWKVEYPGGEGLSASQTISDRFSGVGGSISAAWQRDEWRGGMVLNTPVTLDVQQQTTVGAGGVHQFDSTYDATQDYGVPLDLGIGVSRLMNGHAFTLEGFYHAWGALTPPSSVGGTFKDGVRFSGGWEWSPEFRPLDPIWRAMTYRAGTYRSTGYAASTSGHQPVAFGLSCGLGVPYADGKSRLDLAFTIGWAGDESKDGAKEQTVGFSLSFNHSERWFVGRRERSR